MTRVKTKAEGDLLVISITGEVAAKEMIAIVNEYYPNGVYRNVIWDLSKGSMRADPAEYRAIAEAVKAALGSGVRPDRKTVFIANTASDYTRLCVYAVMAQSAGIPAEYYVCRTMEESLNLIY